MATIIKLKRGTTTPTTSDLANGEVGIDTSAKKFYINDSGTIKEIGGGGTLTLNDLQNVTETSSAKGQYLNYNGSTWRNEFDFNIGKYVPLLEEDGSQTSIQLTNSRDISTIDNLLDNIINQSYYLPFTKSDGSDVTSVELGKIPNIDLLNSTISLSGDSGINAIDLGDTISVSGGNGITTLVSGDSISIDLDNTAVTPGSYGSSTAVPQITVDQQGRITSLSTASISTSFTLDADSGTADTFNNGDTLTISGTANEIETAVTDNTITIGLPDDVTVGNNLTVTGNLTVNGTTTTVATTNTTVSDQLFELGNGRTGSATGDAGIIIERGDDNNVFLGYDESEDEVVFGTGTFTGSSTGDLSITNANIRAADVTATGTLDVSGASTLRGNITLGVNAGDSTEDTITVNGRFVSNLEPLNNITYDLGSPNRRWKDLYLSGNTIDLAGATISGDGTGQILISATGATLPSGSKVGADTISVADSNTGVAVRNVSFFTKVGGLSTAAAIFKFAASASASVFTTNQSFLLSNGSNASGLALFDF